MLPNLIDMNLVHIFFVFELYKVYEKWYLENYL